MPTRTSRWEICSERSKLERKAEPTYKNFFSEIYQLFIIAKSYRRPIYKAQKKSMRWTRYKFLQKLKSLNVEIQAASCKSRSLPLGYDRHHRLYWKFPKSLGGVVVEGGDSDQHVAGISCPTVCSSKSKSI